MHTSGQSGFTYIGLLIFLAILGVASGATLTVGSLMQRRVNEAELMFIGAEFAAAFRSFYEATPSGQGRYPAKVEDLLRDPRYPGIKRHLRRIYIDPISGRQEWGLVAAPGGGLMGVYSFSRLAPIKIAGFDVEFAPLAGTKSYSEWVFGFAPPGAIAPAGKVFGIAPPVPTAPAPAGKGAQPPAPAPGQVPTPPKEEN